MDTFIWLPKQASQATVTPRILVTNFENKLEQFAADGVNILPLSFTLDFSKVQRAEGEAILAFLPGHVTQPFSWVPPAPFDLVPRSFKVDSWTFSYPEANLLSLTVLITETPNQEQSAIGPFPRDLPPCSPVLTSSIGPIVWETVDGLTYTITASGVGPITYAAELLPKADSTTDDRMPKSTLTINGATGILTFTPSPLDDNVQVRISASNANGTGSAILFFDSKLSHQTLVTFAPTSSAVMPVVPGAASPYDLLVCTVANPFPVPVEAYFNGTVCGGLVVSFDEGATKVYPPDTQLYYIFQSSGVSAQMYPSDPRYGDSGSALLSYPSSFVWPPTSTFVDDEEHLNHWLDLGSIPANGRLRVYSRRNHPTTDVATASGTIEIVTYDSVAAPEITSPSVIVRQQGEPFLFQVKATCNATSFAASGLPAGSCMDSASGVIAGNVNAKYTFKAQVLVGNVRSTDHLVLYGSQELTVMVPPADDLAYHFNQGNGEHGNISLKLNSYLAALLTRDLAFSVDRYSGTTYLDSSNMKALFTLFVYDPDAEVGSPEQFLYGADLGAWSFAHNHGWVDGTGAHHIADLPTPNFDWNTSVRDTPLAVYRALSSESFHNVVSEAIAFDPLRAGGRWITRLRVCIVYTSYPALPDPGTQPVTKMVSKIVPVRRKYVTVPAPSISNSSIYFHN